MNMYHLCNRGVDKLKIFLDHSYYLRFVESLALLNNKAGKIRTEKMNIFPRLSEVLAKQEKLVQILCWSLLPNHYHLLVVEASEGGVSEFSRRLDISFTKYFNTKNEGRSGYLFQNKVKIIHISDNAQMQYIPAYIDLNSVSLRFPNWKEDKNRNVDLILNHMKTYKWSSYSNYCGNDEFNIVNKSLFYKLFDTDAKKYEEELFGLIKEPFGIESANPWT